MTQIELLLKSLDSAVNFELGEAFTDFPDADLWKRPDPRLLSFGELACHIAYGEATSILGESFESPVVQKDSRYYPYNIESQVEHSLTSAELFEEIKRIHAACREHILSEPREITDPSPLREGWTIGYVLEYMAFHTAYHTGQMYSVRHLLGHTTPDN